MLQHDYIQKNNEILQHYRSLSDEILQHGYILQRNT